MCRLLLNIFAIVALALLCSLAAPTVNADYNPSHFASVDNDIDVRRSGPKHVRETLAYAFQHQDVALTGRSFPRESATGQVFISTGGQFHSIENAGSESRIRLSREHPPEIRPESQRSSLRHLAPIRRLGGEEADAVNWEAPPENQRQVAHLERGSVTWHVVSLFSAVDLTSHAGWLRWALRFSVFGLVALLFVAWRVRKSRWPAADFPEVGTVTTLPSDLPAPVVSVLESRKVVPQTYMSILLKMLQRGNLTITATGEGHSGQLLHSQVVFARQFEPDRPWEKVVYDALPSDTNDSERLKSLLERHQRNIRAHLDGYLQSRGIFDGPSLEVMADQGQGTVAKLGWALAAVILAIGVGLWVNLWLHWWVGAAIGIPVAFVFFRRALDDDSGRLVPTSMGAMEISRWFAFSESLSVQRVGPSLDPVEPDPLLPYAVALNAAEQWVNNFRALPPWFVATEGRRIPAYRGFLGADSWELLGGPNIKNHITSSDSGSRGGGGGVGDGGGGG